MTTVRRARSRNAWSLAVWGSICALLLAPLTAMQLTKAVAWTGSDFAAAAGLLGIAGLAFEAITRSPLRKTFKVGLLALAGVTVALVWAQGAVGIF